MNIRKYILTLMTLLPGLALVACDAGQAKDAGEVSDNTVAAMRVDVAFPGRTDVFATYHATAALTSDEEATAVGKVAGEVVEILVEEGNSVTSGQVLARLDGDRLKLRMVQAKALLEKTSREYQRNLRLHDQGLVSAAAAEDLKFQLDSQQATFELAKLNYSYTSIRAPISGVVSARDIKLGQHIDVNSPTFKVVNNSKLLAYLKIPQTELSKFVAGHTADVEVDAFPGETWSASIIRISPTVDTTNGTFRATALVDNETKTLAPGMFGRFGIAYEKHSAALTVPSEALVREDNLAVVYVVVDGAAKQRPVVAGIEYDGLVEIISGLEENEQIVVTGHGGLRDGSKVLASNASANPAGG